MTSSNSVLLECGVSELNITSDNHFGHANILKYCPNRQTVCSDVESMNKHMTDEWNKAIEHRPYLIHLGDFKLSKDNPEVGLDGNVFMIKGNHDAHRPSIKADNFNYWHNSAELEILKNGKLLWRYFLSHYEHPLKGSQFNNARHNWMLHGHKHTDTEERQKFLMLHNRFDCGVDYALTVYGKLCPIPFDYVLNKTSILEI